jgi:hypothetical protein
VNPRLEPDMLELGPEHELDIALEASRSESYRVLKSQLEGAGLFTAPGSLLGYGADLVRYTILGAVAAWLYFTSTSVLGWFISAVCLGAFWHQLTCKSHVHRCLPNRRSLTLHSQSSRTMLAILVSPVIPSRIASLVHLWQTG